MPKVQVPGMIMRGVRQDMAGIDPIKQGLLVRKCFRKAEGLLLRDAQDLDRLTELLHRVRYGN